MNDNLKYNRIKKKAGKLSDLPNFSYYILKFSLLLFFCVSFFIVDISAQRSGSQNSSGGFGNNGGFSSGPTSSGNRERDKSRDTLSQEVFVYYADDAEEKQLFQDSSILNFHIYDPVRQAKYEHAHLGNLGSAHRQLVFQQRFRRGLDVGYHNFDLYLTKPEDIPYYNLEKAYSDIYFSQSNQERTSFNAKFSKPVGKNAYLGINYKNIRNDGQYDNQGARANAFSGTYNFQSKNQKYRSYFSFTTNTVEQKENGGGLLTDTVFFRQNNLPVGRPVNTMTGEARYFERDINYTQFYLLQRTPKSTEPEATTLDSLRAAVTKLDTVKIDSTKIITALVDTVSSNAPQKGTQVPAVGKNTPVPQGRSVAPSRPTSPQVPELPKTGRKFTLKHNLSLRKNTYKYVDTRSLSYYGDFVKDDRAVRNFIETNQVENTFSIRTFRLAEGKKASVFGAKKEETPVQKDLIEAGLTHTFTKLYQEPLDSTINNVFLFGKINFTPSERLKIKTYAHLGMLGQIGDYYLKGDFLWDTKKLGKLAFSLTNQLYTPSLLQQRFLVTQQNIWDNDFKKVLENSISASYSIPKLKIDLTANYHLIDNYIYYDTLAQPQQFTDGLSIFQLIAKNKIDVGRFHLENTVYFQPATESVKAVLRFPEIYSIHRLYMDLKLFKVMESQLGGEIRLNSPYFADNYQPLTSQFFLQNDHQVDFYPLMDVFFNFRIQQFRFFITMENLWGYYLRFNDQRRFHYTTYPYPVFDPQMRFGFRWLFLD